MAFICPDCGHSSRDPVDQAEGFCCRCRQFTGDRAHPLQRERLMREGGASRAVWPDDVARWAAEDGARGGHD
jgi:hypothetical protein